MHFDWLSSSVGMSERLKIVRSPVRSRPQPQVLRASRLELVISRFKKLKDRYFDYSMLRWGLVGMTTTFVDFLLFISLYGPISSVFLANLISASVATCMNYLTHHRWTFKSEQNHSRSGFKYLLNLIFWWLVSTSIIKILLVSGLDPKIAKLVPLVLIVPVNYFVLNYLVFKNKS
jgi:putative flippase GtrA